MFYKKAIPLVMNNAFEITGLLFPEAPGAIVEIFGLLIAEQDFFIGEPAGFYKPYCKAKAGATGTEDDIVEWLGQKLGV